MIANTEPITSTTATTASITTGSVSEYASECMSECVSNTIEDKNSMDIQESHIPSEPPFTPSTPSTPFTPTHTHTIPCAICSLRPSLYKCPGCSITTCSCDCVKQHKLQNGCNGKRNRAKYVSKNCFTDKTLRSDYHFLEDTLQLRTSAKRTAGKSFGGGLTSKTKIKSAEESAHTMEEVMSSQQQKGSANHSQSAAKLVKGAKEHGVELALMPAGMTKRKNNTSRYHKKEDKLFWKIQINFILSDSFSVSSTLNFDLNGLSKGGELVGLCSEPHQEVSEDSVLKDVISSFLETTSANLSNRHHLRSLRSHKGELNCFTQHIPSPSQQPLFVQLSMDSTIKECLRGKKIIEFPTFVVGISSHTSKLNLMIREIEPQCPMNVDVAEEQSAATSLISPTGTGADVFLSPNKRKQLDDLSFSAKKIRLGDKDTSAELVTNNDDGPMDEEEDGDEDEVDESFLKQLVDLESADISTLQSLIQTLEKD